MKLIQPLAKNEKKLRIISRGIVPRKKKDQLKMLTLVGGEGSIGVNK